MIVNRKHGTYKVSRCFFLTCHVRGMYVLSEKGVADWYGDAKAVAAEINRREKQKEAELFVSRSRR